MRALLTLALCASCSHDVVFDPCKDGRNGADGSCTTGPTTESEADCGDPNSDLDGDGQPNLTDTDDDGDGVHDLDDPNPCTADPTDPSTDTTDSGTSGSSGSSGTTDTDTTDTTGTSTETPGCTVGPNGQIVCDCGDPNGDLDSDGIRNLKDTDDDGDGLPDFSDSEPCAPGGTGTSTTGGVCFDPNTGLPVPCDCGDPAADIDNDGIPNGTDFDDDGDGVADVKDFDPCGGGGTTTTTTGGTLVCVGPNGGVVPCDCGDPVGDIDGDGIPNAKDDDDDGDGLADPIDPDPCAGATGGSGGTTYGGSGGTSTGTVCVAPNGSVGPCDCGDPKGDIDGDGIPNATDTDDDGDGTPDPSDPTPC